MAFDTMPAASALTGTTLVSSPSINSTTTVITLATGGGAILDGAIRSLANPGAPIEIAVGDEVMLVNDIQDDVIKVTRAIGGTTAAAHAGSAPVYLLSLHSIYALLKAAILTAAPGS